ncbi:hypothetical protein R3P38DRAFT_2874542 [Favolaschia claudopus]|uniref:Secreted protein n=1 Tax=Favolaschia claudopus TaxID=2862362 RepID=A0AAW0D6P5_9AGAR
MRTGEEAKMWVWALLVACSGARMSGGYSRGWRSATKRYQLGKVHWRSSPSSPSVSGREWPPAPPSPTASPLH